MIQAFQRWVESLYREGAEGPNPYPLLLIPLILMGVLGVVVILLWYLSFRAQFVSDARPRRRLPAIEPEDEIEEWELERQRQVRAQRAQQDLWEFTTGRRRRRRPPPPSPPPGAGTGSSG